MNVQSSDLSSGVQSAANGGEVRKLPSNFSIASYGRISDPHSWGSLWFPSEPVHLKTFSMGEINHKSEDCTRSGEGTGITSERKADFTYQTSTYKQSPKSTSSSYPPERATE